MPVFNNAPFLVAVPENSVSLDLIQITKDNFEICVGHTIGEIDTAKFSIMISEK